MPLILVLAATLSGCPGGDAPQQVIRGRDFSPAAGDGIRLARAETGRFAIQTDADVGTPKVDLPGDVLVVSVVDINLDLDEPEEQIIVLKRPDADDRISVAVADFDTLRNTYRLVWEDRTAATNVRTFTVYTLDLVGDHVEEVIAVGTDAEQQQVMHVYRRESSEAAGIVIAFGEVFSAVSDASVEIDERVRPESYRTLQSSGESFPIVVYQRIAETESPLDLMRTTWVWSPLSGRYVEGFSETIPTVQVEEERLRELVNAPVEELESYLDGPWYRVTGAELADTPELASFSLEEREVSLFRGDSLERYTWLNSYKVLYESGPGLWVNLQGDILTAVRRQASIVMTNVDQLAVSIDGAEYWNGTYRRMTPSIQTGIVRDRSIQPSTLRVDGVFRSETGNEILFDGSRFRWRTAEFDLTGGYTVYELDGTLFEFMVGEARPEDATYFERYRGVIEERESDDRLVRRLTLTPVSFSVTGAGDAIGPPSVYEQIIERFE